jgi:hypothetical protein
MASWWSWSHNSYRSFIVVVFMKASITIICLCSLFISETSLSSPDLPDTYLGIPIIGTNTIWYNEYKDIANPLEIKFYTSWLSPISISLQVGMHSNRYFFIEGANRVTETIKFFKTDLSVGWDLNLSESVRITPYIHAYSRNFYKGLAFDSFGANVGGEFRWTFLTKQFPSGEWGGLTLAPRIEIGYSDRGVSYLAGLKFEGVVCHPGAIIEANYEEIDRLKAFNFEILFCWYF